MGGPLRAHAVTNGTDGGSASAMTVIEPDAFVADPAAFVDVRIPRSVGKASYSFIGPGVSQNADQTINVAATHGFNIGAATLPAGAINNPHLHFTAEVFICTRGSFKVTIGANAEQSLEMHAGDIFSIPTWVFRGFENIGDDDGWLFAVLGGDDTGGIIWAPHILEEAAETGLYLGQGNKVLDAEAGDDISAAKLPLRAGALADIEAYSDEELAGRLVSKATADWSTDALLSGVLSPGSLSVAPVIGHGITQRRRHAAPITNPHNFSLDWLRVGGGLETGNHHIDTSQVLLLVDGDWELTVDGETQRPAAGSVVSIDAGATRNLVNAGTGEATAVVVCGGDAPKRLDWSIQIVEAAADAGWALDASGYIAPTELIGGAK